MITSISSYFNKNLDLNESDGSGNINYRIYCNNRAKAVQCEKLLHDNGYHWSHSGDYIISDNPHLFDGEQTYIDINTRLKTFGGYIGHNIENFIELIYPQDILQIKRVLGLIPSYAPRNIGRVLEKIDIDTYKYGSIGFQLNNWDEVKKVVDVFYDKYNINTDGDKQYVLEEISHTYEEIEAWGGYYRPFEMTIFIVSFADNTFFITPKEDVGLYVTGEYQLNPEFLTIEDLSKWEDNTPNYRPRKIIKESVDNKKVLWAFDLDDTLVYSTRFEEVVKPLLVREFLTPEIILQNKIDDIGIQLSDLKYEHGRIYFDDPKQKINISSNSSWTRKGDRVYITQPDAYFLTSESMPIGVHQKIVDIYNNAENKAIVTSRRERLRKQTELALSNLGIKKPNCGLFMYPSDSLVFQAKWKAFKLLDLYKKGEFTELHYFDDNIKVLKRIKRYLQKKDIKFTLYKVNENNYRSI